MLSPEEHQLRREIYDQGGSINVMAEKLNLSYGGFYGWMRAEGLKPHYASPANRNERDRRRRPDQVIVFKRGEPYVHTRPRWERDRVFHFISLAHYITTDITKGQKINMSRFMETYRAMFGRCDEGAIAG